ncbi:MAG: PA-phosphatase [Candidatus Rokuibacteriota bacterium]|nr:MAG: PA-phosphatase [Candidatus Rokubacteria bacterium]
MNGRRPRLRTFALLTLTLLGLTALAGIGPARADEITDWNVIALEVLALGGQNPVVATRGMAMAHLAVHDALNAIDRRYEPYVYDARSEPGAAPAAAVAAAMRVVLIGALPGFGTPEQHAKAKERVEAAYVAALAKIPEGRARQDGIAAGQAAASAMLTLRKADGAIAQMAYTPGTQPGQWRPHPNPVPANPPIADANLAAGNQPSMLPQWGHMTPFIMRAPWQFRLRPPPALTSEIYTRDYNEVKRLGGKQSPARTAAQTEIARFWYEGSVQGWNRIARLVAAQRSLDRWEHARLFALLNAAMADGYIAGADTRYLYNFWRPVTAIRAGDTDGNDATAGDPTWETFMNTPALPDYPSTHSVLGGAAAVVMSRFFGTDQLSFTMTSGPPFAGITRSFKSLSEAQEENGDSRVYSGIHFRNSTVAGILQGEQIGRQAFAQYLQPYRP